jgi:hypothetical protein
MAEVDSCQSFARGFVRYNDVLERAMQTGPIAVVVGKPVSQFVRNSSGDSRRRRY